MAAELVEREPGLKVEREPGLKVEREPRLEVVGAGLPRVRLQLSDDSTRSFGELLFDGCLGLGVRWW